MDYTSSGNLIFLFCFRVGGEPPSVLGIVPSFVAASKEMCWEEEVPPSMAYAILTLKFLFSFVLGVMKWRDRMHTQGSEPFF